MTLSSDTSLQPTAVKQDKRQVIFITLAACLIFWVFVFADSGWGLILTPLSIQLHISLSTAGLLYVVWSTGYLPGALVGGSMLDHYGPRIVLFTASLIVLAGMFSVYLGLLLPQFASFAALLIIAGLAGTGGGIIDATTNGLISSVFVHNRGVALNLFNLLYPLGGVFVALIDAALLKLFNNDPRPPFLFTLCFIGIAVFSLLGIPKAYGRASVERVSPKMASTEKASAARGHATWGRYGLILVLIPVIVAMTFTSGISSSVRAWTPSYLHVAYGLSPAAAAALTGLIWILAALSRLGAAALISRIGTWNMVMLGIVVTLGGLVAMLFSHETVVGTLAIILTSMGLSPIFATFLAIGSERAGRSLGAVAGILLFTSGMSTVFCGWLFGFLLNTAGPQWAVLFCIAFVTAGGLMALRLRPAQPEAR